MAQHTETFKLMIYDALLELATRIGERYRHWARQATSAGDESG